MVTGCAPGVIQEAVCVIKSKALHQWVVQGFNSIFVQATKYPAAPVHQHTQIFEEQIQGSGRCHGHVELIATASVAKHGMISALSIKLDFRDQMAVSKLNGIEICTACISCHSFLTYRLAFLDNTCNFSNFARSHMSFDYGDYKDTTIQICKTGWRVQRSNSLCTLEILRSLESESKSCPQGTEREQRDERAARERERGACLRGTPPQRDRVWKPRAGGRPALFSSIHL